MICDGCSFVVKNPTRQESTLGRCKACIREAGDEVIKETDAEKLAEVRLLYFELDNGPRTGVLVRKNFQLDYAPVILREVEGAIAGGKRFVVIEVGKILIDRS